MYRITSSYDRYLCERIYKQQAKAPYRIVGRGLKTSYSFNELRVKYLFTPSTYLALKKLKHEELWNWNDGVAAANKEIERIRQERSTLLKSFRKAYVQCPRKIT